MPPTPTAPSPTILPVTTGSHTPPPASPDAAAPETFPPNISHPKALIRLRAGIILSRPPILTQAPTPFEAAFYLYQKRLNERLSTPFARRFYFRADQPTALDFRVKFGERRHTMAREIGRITRRGRDAWDDEALVDDGALYASPEYIRERLYTDAESRVSEDGELLEFEDRMQIERPLVRETLADRLVGDVRTDAESRVSENGELLESEDRLQIERPLRRLDRALDRTLYLVVRNSQGRWGFPWDYLRPDEGLHDTAARALSGSAGVNMNTWMVARHPIAHETHAPTYTDDETAEGGRAFKKRGVTTFYLKGRIMAGQADITGNEYGLDDFMWLTKEELKAKLQPVLYSSVELSMPSQ